MFGSRANDYDIYNGNTNIFALKKIEAEEYNIGIVDENKINYSIA